MAWNLEDKFWFNTRQVNTTSIYQHVPFTAGALGIYNYVHSVGSKFNRVVDCLWDRTLRNQWNSRTRISAQTASLILLNRKFSIFITIDHWGSLIIDKIIRLISIHCIIVLYRGYFIELSRINAIIWILWMWQSL